MNKKAVHSLFLSFSVLCFGMMLMAVAISNTHPSPAVEQPLVDMMGFVGLAIVLFGSPFSGLIAYVVVNK